MPQKYNIEVVDCEATLLGEGPHWDAEKETLYYVDLIGKEVRSYHPQSGKSYKVKILSECLGDAAVSLAIPIAGTFDEFVIAHGLSLKRMQWDGFSEIPSQLSSIYVSEESNNVTGRFNEGKCDSRGRLWAGTMAPYNPNPPSDDLTKGILYKIDTNGVITKAFTGFGLLDGIAWSPDNTKLYITDFYTRCVSVLKFNAANGVLSDPKILFSAEAENETGCPDGLAVDAKGNLWVACFNSGRILNIDANTGKVIGRIQLPTSHVTKLAFGDKDLDALYVTTGKFYLTQEQLTADTTAGSLFKITNLGTKGYSSGNAFARKFVSKTE